jgi:MFS family permease
LDIAALRSSDLSEKKPVIHYAWFIAFTGTLVLLLAHGFGRMSYSVILPSMKEGLSLSYTQAGLIGTANFAGYLGLAVIGGFLAVRFGARRTIFVSLIIMGIGLFLTGLSDSFTAALLMRLLTGIGHGSTVVPMMALPAAWFAANKRGLAAGVITIGTGVGLSIVGILIPGLIAGIGPEGWRYAWFLLGVLVFAFSFVCYAFLRDDPGEKDTTMYGSGEPGNAPLDQGLLSAWAVVVREREIWKLGVVYFTFGFSYIIYMTFFVAYLTSEAALLPRKAGGMFAVLGLASILSGVLWGWISDVLGRRNGTLLALLTLVASYVVFAEGKSVPALYVSAILFGAAVSSIPAIVAAAVGDVVGGRLAPAGLGFITLMFGIGQSLGPAVAGWIKDCSGTFSWAFLLSAAVSAAGGGFAMLLRKK